MLYSKFAIKLSLYPLTGITFPTPTVLAYLHPLSLFLSSLSHLSLSLSLSPISPFSPISLSLSHLSPLPPPSSLLSLCLNELIHALPYKIMKSMHYLTSEVSVYT